MSTIYLVTDKDLGLLFEGNLKQFAECFLEDANVYSLMEFCSRNKYHLYMKIMPV